MTSPPTPLASARWWIPLAVVLTFFVAWGFWPGSGLSDPGHGSSPGAIEAGLELLESGDRDGAVALFEQLLREDPTHPGALIELASIATVEMRPDDAERYLRTATEAHPDHAEAWTALGALLLVTERGPDAAASFENAIAADPRYAPARFYYGQMLEDAGLLSRARPEYEWARRLDPDTPYYGLLEARLLWKTYQPVLARTLLAQIDRNTSRPLNAEEAKLRGEILEDLEIWPEGPPPDTLPPDPEDIVDEQPGDPPR